MKRLLFLILALSGVIPCCAHGMYEYGQNGCTYAYDTFSWAIQTDPESVKKMIEDESFDANATCQGLSVLKWAVAVLNLEIVDVLLQKGADPLAIDTTGQNALELSFAISSEVGAQMRKLMLAKIPKTRLLEVYPDNSLLYDILFCQS